MMSMIKNMSERAKIVLVTVALFLLWVLLKLVFGLEFVAMLLETAGFVLGIRWVAREIVGKWLSDHEVEIEISFDKEDTL